MTASSEANFGTQAAVEGYNYANNVDYFSASVPSNGDINTWSYLSNGDNGYGFLPGFFAAPSIYADEATTVTFVNFQRVNDYYKTELADTENVWTASNVDSSVNVETADFVYAGSAAKAISAAIVLATLSIM